MNRAGRLVKIVLVAVGELGEVAVLESGIGNVEYVDSSSYT